MKKSSKFLPLYISIAIIGTIGLFYIGFNTGRNEAIKDKLEKETEVAIKVE